MDCTCYESLTWHYTSLDKTFATLYLGEVCDYLVGRHSFEAEFMEALTGSVY